MTSNERKIQVKSTREQRKEKYNTIKIGYWNLQENGKLVS
jgi:hypothetical protein